MSTFMDSDAMSSALTSSPLMGPFLYLGKRMATSGQTRLQAGQLVLHFSWFWTVMRPSPSTEYTSKRQKERHCMQFVQRS